MLVQDLTNILEFRVAAFSVAAAPTNEALFARGAGLLNDSGALRLGWSWKGSVQNGSQVFRISFGNKDWFTIPGLPSFPWHIP